MTHLSNPQHHKRGVHLRRGRRGVTSIETVVAFALLASVTVVSTQLYIAHGRLLKSQRNYRLALDELSNQLESLGALPPEELSPAVEQLAVSPAALERLPGAELRGEVSNSELGQRVTLEIWWDEPNRQAAPVRLTAWAAPTENASEESEESP
jgi:hypothetical protein